MKSKEEKLKAAIEIINKLELYANENTIYLKNSIIKSVFMCDANVFESLEFFDYLIKYKDDTEYYLITDNVNKVIVFTDNYNEYLGKTFECYCQVQQLRKEFEE